ncbi:sporulation protein YtfJ [Bacillus sp. FJAT-42376]|uniref:GerW family sporulation protein n=1 Tax=Bacillus sp. FJAT-42376 TaxID=2014076 RepID=UPI000F4EDE39|nr:GerW family sporulation protein [Bacillus sp. FJAT-42376]AZB43934.1 sporulation protein YtfJ [Bacillus sp. FJAT-42376]
MSDHPIQGLMKTAMENLKQMVDVNTIIGDPVETPDGSVILTVSKVGFGFAAGGSEFGQPAGEDQSFSQPQAGHVSGNNPKNKMPFGGGSGGGVSITPIAFLIVGHNGVKMLHLDESTHLYERILESAPQTIEKIQKMFKKNDSQSKGQQPSSMRDDIDF